MKKICAILLALYSIISCLFVPVQAAMTEISSDNTIVNGCKSLDAAKTFLGDEKYADNVTSIVLYETHSQTLMYAYNPDVKVEPSSLVKIMTGYIAAEEGNMSDAVTVTEEALTGISASAASSNLVPGEVLTVEQLMHCMLVSSANDAAAVLACYVAGSQEAFVDLMNTYAADLGCTQTNFTNVHGLYDTAQYSSARDLSRILDAALKNEEFRRIFCTTHFTVPATNLSDVRYLSTGNYLMSYDEVAAYYDPRVVGGRTGVTEAGLRHLATLAQSGNMELICITLGSESQLDENGRSIKVFGGYDETRTMLSKGFSDLQLTMVTREDQVLAQQDVINGDSDVVLGPANAVYAVLPKSLKLSDLTFKYAEEITLEAPIQKGDILAFVDIWYEDICVAQTELYAMNSVDVMEQTVADGNQKQGESDKSVLWVTLAVIAGFVLLILILRGFSRVARRKYYNRGRRYRRDRRRSR